MITVTQPDLTPEEIAQRKARKEMLLLQADILCRVYDAGKLREMLDKLRERTNSSETDNQAD